MLSKQITIIQIAGDLHPVAVAIVSMPAESKGICAGPAHMDGQRTVPCKQRGVKQLRGQIRPSHAAFAVSRRAFAFSSTNFLASRAWFFLNHDFHWDRRQ